jgi:nucleoside-diphosphate-sugar epimerase
MKIGIIGATSFLGGRLIKRFLKDNSVKELKLFTSSKHRIQIQNPKINYFNYSFPNTLLNTTDLLNLDLIYFCSALGLEKRDDISEELIIGINTFEPIKLSMELEKKSFSGKLITFGSYFEIGKNNKVYKFKEEEIAFSSRNLFNTYCLSKRMLTNFYSSKINKISWFHFILPNFYGKGEKQSRLIPYLINSIENGTLINITEGKQIRQYIHINDIVDLLMQLVNKEYIPSLYNLVPNEFYSVEEVTNIIVQTYPKKNIKFKRINRYDEKMKVVIADNSKIKNNFLWEPKITLEFGVKNYNKL